jgi:hypothetical protein
LVTALVKQWHGRPYFSSTLFWVLGLVNFSSHYHKLLAPVQTSPFKTLSKASKQKDTQLTFVYKEKFPESLPTDTLSRP